MKSISLIPITLILLGSSGFASLHRGLWFWQNTGSPYGSTSIVGNDLEETATIDFIRNHGVRRVYGSYGTRPVSDAGAVAAWNARLEYAGIQSQLLLSDNEAIFPGPQRNAFLNKIDDRLINFNVAPGRTSDEKFVALHLDLEPQGLAVWDSLSATQKRDHLNHLRETYASIRQHLDNAGLPEFPIYADLPVWFDSSPSIGWTDTAERDAWFSSISVSLTGITLMPFERDSFTAIDNSIAWERANITQAQVRCGIETDVGTTWSSVPVLNAMVFTLEENYGTEGAVDIQSYRLWREALDIQPVLWVDADLSRPADNWLITYQAETGWN
ncbi:MAG: hypothetical protein ACI8T1_001810 [Verrucomicrobiales bacterium]|jgi:hypothetical protein